MVTLFQEYMGTGLIVGWFLLSVIYLLLKEKQKPVRILFVYVPLILLFLFFNPLFARLIYGLIGDWEIYYRILWLVPITVVIAYTLVHIYGRLAGRKRPAFVITAGVMIILSGSYIYQNPHFQKAENLYHMPQSVVDICDAIEVEGREVTAVFPGEMLQYVRQYSPVVCMPYGREMLVERWQNTHPLFQVMEAETVDADELAALARKSECNYIILAENKTVAGSLLELDYTLFDTIAGYDIYLDNTLYIGLFDEL